ncbi:MAG: M48 family metallopeptidase [Candidatus Margulisiibacteriota bacterium]
METQIIRSTTRKKTISAQIKDNTFIVYAPVNFPEKELEKIIEKLRVRLVKKQKKRELNTNIDLNAIAARLNREYFGGMVKIVSIEYSINQNSVFGICNYRTRTIRISHRLSAMPEWVRDYVIVHEMAHILEPNHSPDFWNLVYRYKLAERARGYLIAKSNSSDSPDDLAEGALA